MAPQPIPNTPPQSSKAGTTSTLSGLPPLDGGTTTIDDRLTFEVELECYRRLHELTSGCPGRDRYALSHRLRATCLFSRRGSAQRPLSLRDTVELQLANLAEAYNTARDTAEAARAPAAQDGLESAPADRTMMVGPAGVKTAFNAAASILSSLMSDTRYSGRQVLVPEQALALALAHRWERTSVVFHYPTLFSHRSSGDQAAMKTFIQSLSRVTEARGKAAAALARLLHLIEELKTRAARLHIAYGSNVVAVALESARVQRMLEKASEEGLLPDRRRRDR